MAMGHMLFCENHIKEQVKGLSPEPGRNFGLVIGHICENTTFAVHFCTTPLEDNAVAQKSKAKNVFNYLDDSWITHHAKRVLAMLPGGLDVIGVFLCSYEEILQPEQIEKIRSILSAIYNGFCATKYSCSLDLMKEKFVLLINGRTQKITGKTLYYVSPISSLRPVELKYKSNLSWIRLECDVALDFSFTLQTSTKSSNGLLKQLITGVEPCMRTIDRAQFLFNGQLRRDGEVLLDKAKGDSATVQDIQMFLDQADKCFPCVDTDQSAVNFTFKGCIHLRAFVKTGCRVTDAISALKWDAKRTIISRIEASCENLEGLKGCRIVHEIPRRIYASLPEEGVLQMDRWTISDYIFSDETIEGTADAIMDLFGVEITPDLIEDEFESPSTVQRYEVYGAEEVLLEEDVVPEPKTRVAQNDPSATAYFVGIGVAAVALACSLTYVLTQG